MIGYYNYSVVLTYVSLVSAVWGMTLAMGGHVRLAVMCLMISGLCDCFDGSVARKCKRSDSEKHFGVQIDSLCDLVAFGVFPAMIGYAVGMRSWYWTAALAFFVLSAVIRLGYFNVQEIERAQNGGGHRVDYQGLPVTSIALIAPVLLLIDTLFAPSRALVYPFGILVVGILYILKIRIKKPYNMALVGLAAVGAVIFLLVLFAGGRMDALFA